MLEEVVAAVEGPVVARRFESPDPLVADLAKKIEATYPGHVVDANADLYDATTGEKLTDVDILLQNAAIQVESGYGNGLMRQLGISEQ